MKCGLLKRSFILTIFSLVICITLGWTVVGAAWIGIEFGAELTDEELNQVRGGYAGFHFGIEFAGYWDNLGNISGTLYSDENVLVPEGSSPLSGDAIGQTDLEGASIKAYVGNFQGASGIFQISQSPGSFNVIRNDLIINITIVNVTDESALPSLLPHLAWQ
ncbi:MAG: hypothetical protein JRJ38_19545 [Deltaproteobacteria bacterium]|nr:hypothetical protein [Deltaproteobacteria bacterium]